MDKQPLLIACGILKKEVERVFKDQHWSCDRHFLTSSYHFDSEKLQHSLNKIIAGNPDKNVVLLYGSCHPAIDSMPDVRRVPCQNCVEMLLGKQLFNDELSRGAYFLLEEWAVAWDDILEKTFGNRQVAREIFQGDRSCLLALRTPCSGDFSAQAEAAAASVGLPLRWLDVSLDHLAHVLKEQLLQEQENPEAAEIEALKKKLAYQEQRANRLAGEKSYLQLVNSMMNRLSALPGLENTLNNLLELVVDSLGGTDAVIYYYVDGSIHYADLKGGHGVAENIADPLVCEALQSGQLTQQDCKFSDTMMHTRIFSSASTWLVPLIAGNSTIGLFKIENMHLDSEQFLPNLGAFFSYAALILTNEIQNYVQLQRAFETLKEEKDEHQASRMVLEQALRELKISNQQLLQQEKMASIGQLAAGVAHEINNPMGFISSNLATLHKYMQKVVEYLTFSDHALAESECAGKRETAEARRRLKIDYVISDTCELIAESLDGATRVKAIVNDLKNLARTDQVRPVATDLNACLQSALNIACNEIKYVAEVRTDYGSLPHILCHPQQISQVFINLLTNAGQAIAGHGSITIRTWCDDATVYISVADSGCGISDENKKRIFEPFFTTKEVGKGTGLGLSISYGIIRKHGGEINVDSIIGEGSTFTVSLPVAGAPLELSVTEAENHT
ncbi:MAG TPA: DUF1638 domain-containing protein [Desulfuromonadales bacterium]|nr:DUF1638 domain-containing protein [Desulfuromonadales bacterium]